MSFAVLLSQFCMWVREFYWGWDWLGTRVFPTLLRVGNAVVDVTGS
jgi:hypothetical protein